jgi:hypothetical protein
MFNKDKSVSDGFGVWCKPCKKEYKSSWYAKNAESERKKAMQYHYENYDKNKEKYAEKSKRCYERTKHNKFAYEAFARAARRNAVPKWISTELKQEIQKFYVEARLKTRDTGTKYEVDHIVPLIGKKVCGLHVPWNLRVITQFENRIKQNRFEE